MVSWNVRALVLRAVASVAAAGVRTRTVVVDNASADGTVAALRSAHPALTVIASAENLGFSAGNNRALEALGVLPSPAPDAPPFVLLLNPDAELRPGALEALVAHLEARPALGAVGPLLRYPDGRIQSSRRRFPDLAAGLTEATPFEWHRPNPRPARRMRMDDVPPTAPQAVDWLNGAAILLRSEAVAAVGGFDEGFFMYSEELDLCRRLRDAGWAVDFTPAAEVIHHEGRSSEQVVAQRHVRFMRSRVRYFAKHHGPAAAAVVRWGIRAQYVAEIGLETLKWLAGSRRALRKERVRAYWGVVRAL